MASTPVKPGIYGLAFTMGKWFLTDNSAMVGRILMIFWQTPMKFESKHLKIQLGSPVSNKKSTLPVSWDPPPVMKN